MKTSGAGPGFTEVDLVVVVVVLGAIVLLLFSISLPGGGVRTRAPQTKALSDAKQIGLACKAFATDHDGQFPGFTVVNGTTSGTQISDYSNTAFNQLFPDYLTTIRPFYLPKSAWTPVQFPDPRPTAMASGAPSLPAGSNEWAYVVGLSDSSTSIFPMIADGFADLKTHAYTTDETARGGVWKGRQAIVVFCDDSAKVMKCDPSTYVAPGSPDGADLFDTGGQKGWLDGTRADGQHVLNPR